MAKQMDNLMYAHMAAFTLVIVGALNWGLVGLFDYNLVNSLLGSWPDAERVIYILVGLSALYLALKHKGDCTMCSKS